MLDVIPAASPSHLDAVRSLMRQYIAWHRLRHAPFRAIIDRYFDQQSFETELAGLPGEFAPPQGRILLGYANGRPAGMVALRDLGGGLCEMKRMFVAPDAHGLGLGRALARRLIEEARIIGYKTMRLDTGPLQHEAHRLYASLGFCRTDPYGRHDADMRDWLLFMELDLARLDARWKSADRLESA